jgi:hypothetical protein
LYLPSRGVSGRSTASSKERVEQPKHHNRADDRNKETVQIETGDGVAADQTKKPTADYRSNNSKQDIADDTLASFIYNLTADKSRDETQYNPGNKRHELLSLSRLISTHEQLATACVSPRITE